MDKPLKELFEEYVAAQRRALHIENEFYEKLINTLKKVIPDIRLTLYDVTSTYVIEAPSHSVNGWRCKGIDVDKLSHLGSILMDFFGKGALAFVPLAVDVYVTQEEAEKIKRLLEGDVDG